MSCRLHLHTFGAAETSRKMKVECYECNVQAMVFVDKMYFGAIGVLIGDRAISDVGAVLPEVYVQI